MFNRVTSLTLHILVFALPLFFWTLTPNFFSTPKEFLVLLTLVIVTIVYFLHLLLTKQLTLPRNGLVVPLLLFMASIAISLTLNPEGRPEALASKGMILLLLPFLTLILSSLSSPKPLIRSLTTTFVYATAILAAYSLMSLTFLTDLAWLPAFMQSKTFTPTGSYLTTLTLFATSIAIALSQLSVASARFKSFLLAHLTITIIASVAILSLMLPGSLLSLNLIPYGASWSITLDALKSLRSLLFGIGLSNFSLLYTAVKPLTLNLTPLWNILPTGTSSELLTLLATGGIIPTLTLIFLMFKGLMYTKNSPYFFPLITLILAIFFTPATLIHYCLFFIILGLSIHAEARTTTLPTNTALIASGAGIGLVLFLSYTLSRPFIGEYFMRRAQLALTQNDGKAVYDNHRSALSFYPRMSGYHTSFATVNLSLASALSQKSDLTDTDRENIAQLIQQSVQSGKTATSLRPNDAAAWVTLATTYQNLINVAQGSDQFTIDAYARAISLDRANPTLRIQFGGLLMQLGTTAKDEQIKATYLDRAQNEFQTAIQLKPDYGNAYYNLAKLLESRGKYEEAVAAMQQVVKYLDASSADAARAQAELDTLKTKVPAKTPAPSPTPTPAPSTELTTPSPLPSPLDGGPIELPQQ